MIEARRFSQGAVCAPHYLASSAGLAVLASGGNALDAAVAMNLALGVVAPYLCGYGGDLFALIWSDGLFGYNGSGRASASSQPEAVIAMAETSTMPERGPLSVTVPGAPEAWFSLLDRFGTRSFGDLAAPALRYAAEGFPLTELGASNLAEEAADLGGYEDWRAVYGAARAGDVFRQPDLARTIRALSEDGPDAYYRGSIAMAVAEQMGKLGGQITAKDLDAHGGEWIEPLVTSYRGVDVAELPPNTQGVAVLEALNIVQMAGSLPHEGAEREHLLIEAVKMALSDRDAHVTDPAHMRIDPAELISAPWATRRAATFDRDRAGNPRSGGRVDSGTAALCAADRDGMFVSLIQSNYAGFGSGVTVPGWGINLHNRGACFSLSADDANVIAPSKRTMHTLIPAMALKDRRPWLAFGTMGGDGQAQTHVQLLARIVDDAQDVQRALSAPRWMASPRDWSVVAESRFARSTIDGLVARGHHVTETGPFDSLLGHANAIQAVEGGYAGATDPRSEGSALGL